MMTERSWIRWLQSRWPQVDLRHDTFFDPASRQILTTDMLVEGVHFSWEYYTPQDLGWKSIAVNLSDIAATGGSPKWILVSLGINQEQANQLLPQIAEGIEACCKAYQCIVTGGDTVQSEKTVISVTAIGALPPYSQPGRRNRSQAGDIIATSGFYGLSQAGLIALQNHFEGFLDAKAAHLRPIPQIKLGQQIAQVVPRFAMMDSSDGLANAVIQLAEASQVNIILDEKRLTVHPEVQQLADRVQANPIDWILYGGEDFQLVVSLPPETLNLFPDLKPIGYVDSVTNNRPQAYLRQEGHLEPLNDQKSFQHFNLRQASPCSEESSF